MFPIALVAPRAVAKNADASKHKERPTEFILPHAGLIENEYDAVGFEWQTELVQEVP